MDEAQQTESDQGIQVGMVGHWAAETSGRLMSWMDMINPFFVWRLKEGILNPEKYSTLKNLLYTKGFFMGNMTIIIYNRFTSLPSRLGHVNINQTFILPSGPRFF